MWGRPYISIEFGEHAVLWFTGIATFLLFLATAGLVVVAVKALGQLQVAVDQLEEVRKDRYVQAAIDFVAEAANASGWTSAQRDHYT